MIVVKSICEIVKILNCAFEIFILYSFLELVFPVYEQRKNIKYMDAGICTALIFLVNSIGGSVKKFVSMEKNSSFLVRIKI